MGKEVKEDNSKVVKDNIWRFEKVVRDVLDKIGFVGVPFTYSYNGKADPVYETFAISYAGWNITGNVDGNFSVKSYSFCAKRKGYKTITGDDVCPERLVEAKPLDMDLEFAKDKATMISEFYLKQATLMDKYGKVVDLSILEK